jgi:hypothetical protein
MSIGSYEDRYKYLRIGGIVGESTFGFDRWLNQILYKSDSWLEVRDEVISRDDGFDMGHPDYPINGIIIVHHMNPITVEDVLNRNPDIFNPEFLISVAKRTHDAIHFGDGSLLPQPVIERKPYDTSPWRN